MSEPDDYGLCKRSMGGNVLKALDKSNMEEVFMPGCYREIPKPKFYGLLDKDGGFPAGVEPIEFGPAKDGESRNTNRIVFVVEQTGEITGADVFDKGRMEVPNVQVTGLTEPPYCFVMGQEIVFEPGSIIATIKVEK